MKLKNRLICLIQASWTVAASSSSDWTCLAGEAAVNNFIASDEGESIAIDSGPLSKHGFELYISNQLIDPDRHTILQAGMDYVVRIKVTEDRFRGAFLRLEASAATDDVDTSNALKPRDRMMQVNDECQGSVIGIGTVDFRPKPGVTASLRMEEPVWATMDVTIVKTQTNDQLTYAFSHYKLEFVQNMPPAEIPTPSPTEVPTAAAAGFCSANRLEQCQLDNQSSQESDACNSCVGNVLSQNITSCSQLEVIICSALADCSCNSCATILEAYLSCAYQTVLGCSIDCGASQSDATAKPIVDEFTVTS